MGTTIGFVIWCIIGFAIICLGVYALFSKKPIGFWANAKVFEVNDTQKYNRAIAKLFCVYGIIFILLGIPLLSGQNSPWIIVSILGVVIESIAAMAIYSTVIEGKYKK